MVAFPCTHCSHCGRHMDKAFDFKKSLTAQWLRCKGFSREEYERSGALAGQLKR